MTLLHNQISQSLLCVSQWKKHLFAQKALNSKAIGCGSSAPHLLKLGLRKRHPFSNKAVQVAGREEALQRSTMCDFHDFGLT